MQTRPGNKVAAAHAGGMAGVAATAAAALACYGTLAVVSLLGLLGFRVAVNEAAWGGAILVLAGLAVLAILAGARRHGSLAPGIVALVGGGLIAYALLVEYVFYLELAGFVALSTAAVYDLRQRRRPRPAPGRGA